MNVSNQREDDPRETAREVLALGAERHARIAEVEASAHQLERALEELRSLAKGLRAAIVHDEPLVSSSVSSDELDPLDGSENR